MIRIFYSLLLMLMLGCSQQHNKDPHVIIESKMGTIEIELYAEKATKTVKAFLNNVEAGVYDNSSFYRVLKTEELPSDFNTGIIQAGIWQSNKMKSSKFIEHESTNKTGLSHKDGIVSMARTDTGTASTEFFICIGDQSPLDSGRRGSKDGQGFAAFGKVVKGMSVVRKIQGQKSMGDHFITKIDIMKIKRSD